MSEPDGLTPLASELRAMPARQQRSILDALTPFERAQAKLLLTQPLIGTENPGAADDSQAFSPWLAERIRAARRPAEDGESTMTAATRALLAQLAQQPRGKGESTRTALSVPSARRSLLDIAWSALARQRGVR